MEELVMKCTAIRLMFATAVVAVVTSVASAQTMKADIPFAFRFGKEMYPAGTYRVQVQGPYSTVRISNLETRHDAVMLVTSTETPAAAWRATGAPVMAFECGLGRCQLTQIWAGFDRPALSLPHPRLGRDEVATLRVVH